MDEDKNLQPLQPDEPTEPELDENGNPIVDMTDADAADVAPTAGETIKLKADHSKTLELKTVEDVMEYSYLRYSMSVIIDRALPDVRDGMKPVHRRILYTMERNGWRPNGGFVKRR